MKKLNTATALVFALLLSSSLTFGQTSSVKINLSNIRNATGVIHIGFYKAGNDFPQVGKQSFELKATPTGKDTLSVTATAVPVGEYAIAIYQDVNQNGKLDANWLGMPKEPYAFSQNVHPKLSKPDFGECKVTVSETTLLINIQLIN